jgi:putative MATE family efflux protein
MYFVGIAGVLNILLDYLLIGAFDLGAAGAALATIISQACSVLLALMVMGKLKLGIHLIREDFRIDPPVMKNILKVGLPVAAQDGFVQISFLVITVIANRRGVDAAAAVGIVEKLISFMFLVPSAMLSTVSAMAAQNAGAGFHERGRRALYYGIGITILVGFLFVILCQIWPEQILSLFAKEEPAVVQMGAQYLRSYVFDCAIAGVHFCFSGYFCAYQKSMISFGHNMASILLVRIPGAYFASRKYPDTLFPMGMAAPLGSLLSSLICVTVFLIMQRQNRQGGKS